MSILNNNVEYKENYDLQKIKSYSSVAMTILLISLAMLFATLFLVYAVLRGSSSVWPPIGIKNISLEFPTISTLAIIFSSIFYMIFERYIKKVDYFNYQFQIRIFFALTLTLAFLFLISQRLLWNQMDEVGLFTSTGTFASLIYAFTWIHAFHILIGIGGFLWLIPFVKKLSKNYFNEEILHKKYYIRVGHVGLFWHFLGVIWLIMYFSMFVF